MAFEPRKENPAGLDIIRLNIIFSDPLDDLIVLFEFAEFISEYLLVGPDLVITEYVLEVSNFPEGLSDPPSLELDLKFVN